MKSRKFWTIGGARAGYAPPKSATAKCKIQEAPPSSCHVIIIRLFPLRENKLGSATTKLVWTKEKLHMVKIIFIF